MSSQGLSGVTICETALYGQGILRPVLGLADFLQKFFRRPRRSLKWLYSSLSALGATYNSGITKWVKQIGSNGQDVCEYLAVWLAPTWGSET